ncbi:uncharacterized protein LOC142986025 [Anticarsia gemmatalis]|uniref:uncharacterized protein LOC142986025 n=1 Tax=Anticarsia gemmatalis TaxID=129554 RepID=UPI003F765399
MVVTRSQGDVAETEEQRSALERRELETQETLRREMERIERERVQRLSLEPPGTSLSRLVADHTARVCTANTELTRTTDRQVMTDQRRPVSPVRSTRSRHSRRSTASASTRLRMAELEAAEKLAAIRRKELELEADLVKKRLAVEVSAIHDDQESLHGEPVTHPEHNRKVDEWLQTNPLSAQEATGGSREEPRPLRFDLPRERSPPSPREKSDMDKLAEALEKMARPRVRHSDLPTFTGAVNEWLPFKAAVRDTTRMYHISAAENLQRLRSALKREARDAVAALLHTATDPDVIMRTLEQCFGRPEVIIDRTLDELRKMPRPGSTSTELNSFAIKVQNAICVLENMDRRGYLYNPLLTREVLEKLSPYLRSRWCDYASEHEQTTDPEIVLLSRFLMREADRALKFTYAPSGGLTPASKKEFKTVVSEQRKKASTVYTVIDHSEVRPGCPACGADHVLTRCPKYEAWTTDQRWNFVRENKMCYKCAQSTHRRWQCNAKPCGVSQCRRPHHASLHQTPEKSSTATEPEPAVQEAVMSVAHRSAAGPRDVLLKMCPVVVAGPRGEVKTYALLDEGATITLVDEDLTTRIGAEGPARPLHLRGVNMNQSEKDSKLVTLHIRGVKTTTTHQIRARTIKNLRLHQQSIPESLMKLEHLRDLPPDEICYDLARPGILVGSDHWEHIVSRELRVGGPNEPAASKTQLGWVVHGTAPRHLMMKTENVLHVYKSERSENRQLHDFVEKRSKGAAGTASEPRASDAEQRANASARETDEKTDRSFSRARTITKRNYDDDVVVKYDSPQQVWNTRQEQCQNKTLGLDRNAERRTQAEVCAQTRAFTDGKAIQRSLSSGNASRRPDLRRSEQGNCHLAVIPEHCQPTAPTERRQLNQRSRQAEHVTKSVVNEKEKVRPARRYRRPNTPRRRRRKKDRRRKDRDRSLSTPRQEARRIMKVEEATRAAPGGELLTTSATSP